MPLLTGVVVAACGREKRVLIGEELAVGDIGKDTTFSGLVQCKGRGDTAVVRVFDPAQPFALVPVPPLKNPDDKLLLKLTYKDPEGRGDPEVQADSIRRPRAIPSFISVQAAPRRVERCATPACYPVPNAVVYYPNNPSQPNPTNIKKSFYVCVNHCV